VKRRGNGRQSDHAVFWSVARDFSPLQTAMSTLGHVQSPTQRLLATVVQKVKGRGVKLTICLLSKPRLRTNADINLLQDFMDYTGRIFPLSVTFM
jgi:hypothetical protein